MYFGKNEFYQIARDNGGMWNDSKERPLLCLMKSLDLELENRKPNYFRQRITDIKNYLIAELNE